MVLLGRSYFCEKKQKIWDQIVLDLDILYEIPIECFNQKNIWINRVNEIEGIDILKSVKLNYDPDPIIPLNKDPVNKLTRYEYSAIRDYLIEKLIPIYTREAELNEMSGQDALQELLEIQKKKLIYICATKQIHDLYNDQTRNDVHIDMHRIMLEKEWENKTLFWKLMTGFVCIVSFLINGDVKKWVMKLLG